MRYDAILFDLDGTLLPMDNDYFTKRYLHLLAQTVAPLGYTEETLIPATWKGVSAMVKNDGSATNAQVFWRVFAENFGEKIYDDIADFDVFYQTEFHKTKEYTAPTEISKEIVSAAKQIAGKVVLATNPFFPRVAVETRLSWLGLSCADFDLVTDYENSYFCKPNPKYYKAIAADLGVEPARCLMVGNNTEEDILASQKLGMKTYLVTDYPIGDISEVESEKGSLEDLLLYLKKEV